MHTGQSGYESGSTWLSRNGWWIRFLCHVAITFAAYRIFLVSGPLSDTGFIPRRMLPFLLFSSGIFWLMLPSSVLFYGLLNGQKSDSFSLGLEAFGGGFIWAMLTAFSCGFLNLEKNAGLFNGLTRGVMTMLMISAILNGIFLGFFYSHFLARDKDKVFRGGE
jgi:hypothetical protein